MSKIIYGSANCRDLTALKRSLVFLPQIKNQLEGFKSSLLSEQHTYLDVLSDIHDLIEASITDDPPFSVREGGIIKDGYDETVDQYRKAMVEGKQWIAALESDEREKKQASRT